MTIIEGLKFLFSWEFLILKNERNTVSLIANRTVFHSVICNALILSSVLIFWSNEHMSLGL